MRNLKYLALLLCALVMTSCIDWQKRYDKDLVEAANPIKEKHEFAMAKSHEAWDNHHCRIYNSMADIPTDTLTNVFLNVLFMEDDCFPPSHQPSLPGVLYVYSDKTKTKTNDLFDLYVRSFRRQVIRRHDYKNYMKVFQEDVLQKYQEARYLVVISDSIYVKPKCLKNDEFITGSYLDKVTIYDLNTFEKKQELIVLSRNSAHLMVSEEYSMTDNLAECRSDFIGAKVKEAIK